MDLSTPYSPRLIIGDRGLYFLYLCYTLILCLFIFVQINAILVGTLIILLYFLSLRSIYRSTLFFVAIWQLYLFVVIWTNDDNWNNIKFVLGNSTLLFVIVLKYARYENIKKCIPLFLLVLYYFLYNSPLQFHSFFDFNPVSFFRKLFAMRNALSLIFMGIFLKTLTEDRKGYDLLTTSMLSILMIYALISIASFLYYPIIKEFWEYKFDLLFFQKRGIDFTFERGFWETGNALTRIGNYYIPRFSGVYFHAITAGYIFGCSFVIALIRKKKGYATIFGLASFLTFAKVSWMIIGVSGTLIILRKRLADTYLVIISCGLLSAIFIVIYFDLIPSGAVVHLLGFIRMVEDWNQYIFGYGLGIGGTWAAQLKGVFAHAGKGAESGIGVLMAEMGITGCVLYFWTLSKLFEARQFSRFTWAIVLMVLCIMILQENYASPIPAFVLTWMIFEVKDHYPRVAQRGKVKAHVGLKRLKFSRIVNGSR